MSSVDISIDFGSRLGASLQDFGTFAGQARDVLLEARLSWQEDLISTWPVDTGTSLQAWENYIDGMMWVLRNPVEYASYVHEAGDDTPLVEYLEAQAETYAAQALGELRRLLNLALRQTVQPQMFGRRQGPSLSSLLGDAVFGATVRAFQTQGARQRLRERFPNEPIGRAATRRRTRAR